MHTKEIICWQCKAPNQVEDNAPELLRELKNAARWVAKCSADHGDDYIGKRAHKTLESIEMAIANAKGVKK